MTVFDLFQETEYTFLELSRGGVEGNSVTSSKTALGVFKLRDGMTSETNQEARQSSATLHVHPEETFAFTNMVGHGISKDGQDYEIIGSVAGDNFETNVREFYRLTLQRANFSKAEA